MELTKKVPTTDKNQENNHLLRMLDRGIDDMEAGRELPLEDAFRKITELKSLPSPVTAYSRSIYNHIYALFTRIAIIKSPIT